MTFKRQDWNETIRLQLIQAHWVEEHTKSRWIQQMDNPQNLQTFVDMQPNQNVVYIAFERRQEGFVYTAGKRIRVHNFDFDLVHN